MSNTPHKDYATLAQSIDSLIEKYQQTQTENIALHKKNQSLAEEKIQLMKKNEAARFRISAIVKTLKQS